MFIIGTAQSSLLYRSVIKTRDWLPEFAGGKRAKDFNYNKFK